MKVKNYEKLRTIHSIFLLLGQIWAQICPKIKNMLRITFKNNIKVVLKNIEAEPKLQYSLPGFAGTNFSE